ncbi:MAG: DNA polymerase-3 subunit epsilon [Paracoccaceae bacterium]|jgi:DNA polymerase-3 subunit epsilon
MRRLAPDGLERLSLRVRVFLFFALIGAAGAAAVIGGLMVAWRRLPPQDGIASALITAGLVGCAELLAVTLWVWLRFDDHVTCPIDALAQNLAARARVDAGPIRDAAAGRWLGALAPAAQDAAATLHGARGALAGAVPKETAALTARRAQLESVINALPDGVAICTHDHRLMLFNARAQALPGDSPALGLDRPLGRWLDTAPLDAALACGPGAAGLPVRCVAADAGADAREADRAAGGRGRRALLCAVVS